MTSPDTLAPLPISLERDPDFVRVRAKDILKYYIERPDELSAAAYRPELAADLSEVAKAELEDATKEGQAAKQTNQ
ncbi:MAG: hypothetical protein JWN38_361 [Candidatus Saccharibacteria bacterium]|nr:hypothetical protein [Candidatus Saccharibacteria bacterium]